MKHGERKQVVPEHQAHLTNQNVTYIINIINILILFTMNLILYLSSITKEKHC